MSTSAYLNTNDTYALTHHINTASKAKINKNFLTHNKKSIVEILVISIIIVTTISKKKNNYSRVV